MISGKKNCPVRLKNATTWTSWVWSSKSPLLSIPKPILFGKLQVLYIQKLPLLWTFKYGQSRVHPYMEMDKSLCWNVADHCSVSTISPRLWYFSLKVNLHYPVRSRYSIQDKLGLPTPVYKSIFLEVIEMNKVYSSDSKRKFLSC